MTQVFNCEQGSPEWFAARAGIPTASMFATVLSEPRYDGTLPADVMDSMVKSGCTAEQLAAAVKAARKKNSSPAAMRREYMRKLAGEIITGEPMEGYSNAHMERGKEMEGEARDTYCFIHGVQPESIGFIRSGDKGCSPDSLIGANGMCEIKTKLPHLQIDVLLRNELPSEHRAQCQGNLWVAEREWIDFISYWPKLPLFVHRVYRDEDYISRLATAVDMFNGELATLVERVQAFNAPAEDDSWRTNPLRAG